MKSFRSFSKIKVFSHNRKLAPGLRTISGKWIKQKEGCADGVLTSTHDFTPVTGVTLPEYVFQNLGKWENAPAIKCALTGRQYSHGDVYRKSQSFAVALKQAGLKLQDCVCILLPNIPEYPIVAFGAMQAGCIVSTINPVYTKAEITNQINDCEGKIVVTIPQLVPLVEAARPHCPSLTHKTIVIGAEPVENTLSFFEMLKTNATGVQLLKGSDINPTEESALLPYSSGTTGNPKGVQLSHGALATNIKQILLKGHSQIRFFDCGQPQDRFLCVLPFFHMYGFHIIMATALHCGAFLSCLPKFEPETYAKAIKEHQPTCLHLVPPLINFLSSSPLVTPEFLKELRGVQIGAAPVGRELISKFLTKFGDHIFIQEGYGMSEITVTHMVPPEIHNKMQGSCGVALPGVTFKIVDTDTGKILGANQTGEICATGPMVMKGYLKNEQATRKSFDEERFMHTGDIGYYDEQGFLYIEDRMKDLIKVKGLQVAPSEVEDVLRKHPDIADVAVVGVPHERNGEAPRAYVVRKNEKLTVEDVKEFVKPQLAAHKHLKGGVQFMDIIPKAASGKILKRLLLADYKAKM